MATDLGIHLVPQAGVAPSQVWAEAGETLGFLTIVGNPGLTPWAP